MIETQVTIFTEDIGIAATGVDSAPTHRVYTRFNTARSPRDPEDTFLPSCEYNDIIALELI